MLRMRCKQGGLFLTADLMVPDGQVGPSSDRRDVSATKKSSAPSQLKIW
jgi:hypothetical protein